MGSYPKSVTQNDFLDLGGFTGTILWVKSYKIWVIWVFKVYNNLYTYIQTQIRSKSTLWEFLYTSLAFFLGCMFFSVRPSVMTSFPPTAEAIALHSDKASTTRSTHVTNAERYVYPIL